MRKVVAALVVGAIVGAAAVAASPSRADEGKEKPVELGNFSVSLTVKDLAASRAFYEKLGFVSAGGDPKQKWVVLKNGVARVGLFQGMFEKNMLTFNPGWTPDAKPVEKFQDVREIQKVLKERGLVPEPQADEASKGTAFFMVVDPDGNPILVDQHVPRPAK